MRQIVLAFLLLLWATGKAWARVEIGEDPPRACFEAEEAVQQVCISSVDFSDDTCKAIAVYARHWSLPPAFLARLIWQESRFDPKAVSPVGAQGIAQFMPGTAEMRRLSDSFNPAEALARSAEYLRHLELKFGNLGLAAAAYNAGEGALTRLTKRGGAAHRETRNYVNLITGHSIDQWLSEPPDYVSYDLQTGIEFHEACLELAFNSELEAMHDRNHQPSLIFAGLFRGINVAETFVIAVARDASQLPGTAEPARDSEPEIVLAALHPPGLDPIETAPKIVEEQAEPSLSAIEIMPPVEEVLPEPALAAVEVAPIIEELQPDPAIPPQDQPWGVQLAEHFSTDIAQRTFRRLTGEYAALIGNEEPMMVAVRNPNFGGKLRHAATIGRATREEADALCESLRAAGGACVVIRN